MEITTDKAIWQVLPAKLEEYTKYKATNIPWLTEVPEDWDVMRAKNMFKKENREVRKDDKVITCFRDGEVTLRENRRTTGFTESIKEIGYQGIRKGDLVIHIMDAFAGAIGVSDSEEKGTPVYSVCSSKGSFNVYYYAHILRQMAKNGFIQSLYRGIRERSSDFRYEVFAEQLLPLPPLPIQSRIVSYLDSKISAINKLIEAKKRQVELLKEELYTYLFSEKGDIESLGYWDNCFPQHWVSTTVKRIFHETSNKGYTDKELLAVTQDRGVLYKNDCSENFVSPRGDYSSQKLVLPHDFIISLRSFQGGIEASLIEGLVSPAYTVFSMTDYNELLFIYYRHLFKTKLFIAFLNTLVADTRDGKKIGFKEFRDFYMPVPPVSHLEKIKELSLRLDILVIQVEKYLQLLTEYKISLISDVVTGKVEVRAIWDDDGNKWWFNVVDIVAVLNEQDDYTKANNYWRWLKRKLKSENNQLVSATHGFKKVEIITKEEDKI